MSKVYHFRDWGGRILATKEVADDGRVFYSQSVLHTEPSTFLYEAQCILDGTVTVAIRKDSDGIQRWRVYRRDDRVEMFDPETEGKHSLDFASTTPERLAAHWRGFIGIN